MKVFVQVLLIVLGVILMLPGGCSLFIMIGSLTDALRKGRGLDSLSDGYGQVAMVVWVLTFLLAGFGWLLVLAGRALRQDALADAGPSQPPEQATPPDPQSGSGEDQA